MYLVFKFFHIGGAIVSLGAMLGVLVLGWSVREGTDNAGLLRVQFERLVSIGGMVLVAAGAALTHLRGWAELFHSFWLAATLALVILGAVIERQCEPWFPLHVFALVRALPYVTALALMIFKPS